ncbi:MAG TPA: Rieske 2Fe-2S domain-containing protein [Acidimicrobiales bacterium]|nr:Rieske 2Fe-2S domain-containing protein [Acidimicrobiales bacterium]
MHDVAEDRPQVLGASGPRSGPRVAAGHGATEVVEIPDEVSWGWLGPPSRALYSAGWVLLPLRAFLGFTFCFAGLQKLANPAFFDAANPASIQAQLAGAARRSPIHGLVSPLIHVAVPLGILIALGELAVGLGTLAGLWTRAAAAGGALLSLMLFLTISFHSSPYFTGSDIVFLFAWTPLLLSGSGGVLSADAVLANRARRREGADLSAVVPIPFAAVRRVCGNYEDGRCNARRGAACAPAPCPFLLWRPRQARRVAQLENEIDRRTFASKGAAAAGLAAAGVLVAGAAAAIGRLAGGTSHSPSTPNLGGAAASGQAGSASSSTTATSAPSTRPTTKPTTAPTQPPGTRIGPARDVPLGGAASFADPSSGDPSLVIQPSSGTFLAFDAVCPHAGCTVEYDGSAKLFVCPCHGSEFNGSTGAVETGPATRGLLRLQIAEGSDGELYVG